MKLIELVNGRLIPEHMIGGFEPTRKDGKPDWEHLDCIERDGRLLGKVRRDQVLDQPLCHLPATGWRVLSIWDYGDKIEHDLYDVIVWRVFAGYVEPVLARCECDNETRLLVEPSGKVFDPDSEEFASIEEAIAAFEAKQAAKHAQPPQSAA